MIICHKPPARPHKPPAGQDAADIPVYSSGDISRRPRRTPGTPGTPDRISDMKCDDIRIIRCLLSRYKPDIHTYINFINLNRRTRGPGGRRPGIRIKSDHQIRCIVRHEPPDAGHMTRAGESGKRRRDKNKDRTAGFYGAAVFYRAGRGRSGRNKGAGRGLPPELSD